MPTLNVVWDTNVYRGWGRAVFDDVVASERARGVRALANYFVAFELLMHLDDPSDPSLPAAVAALRRMWHHGKRPEGEQEVLDFVADSEAQVCWTLFGKKPARRAQDVSLYGATIGELANVATAADLSTQAKAVVAALRKHVTRVEQQFVDDLFRAVVVQVAPAATSWSDASRPGPMRDRLLATIRTGAGLPLVAATFAEKAARDLGITIDDATRASKGTDVLSAFPTPIHVYDRLVLDVLEKGHDMGSPGRRNSLWDLQIAFSTGTGARLAGAPIVVVTDDALIHAAARAAGTSAYFWHPDRYRQLLGDPNAFHAAVAAT